MEADDLKTRFVAMRTAALNDRRAILTSTPVPPAYVPHNIGIREDPFEFETRGVYFARRPILPVDKDKSAEISPHATVIPKQSMARGRVDGGRIAKRKGRADNPDGPATTPTRASKRKAYWDDEQDRILRRSLRKWGWGCWKRIERSARLPSEYTAKMIANRAKALNLQNPSASKVENELRKPAGSLTNEESAGGKATLPGDGC